MTREHFDPEWKKKVDEKRNNSPELQAALEEKECIKAAFVTVAETAAGQTMFKALMQDLGFKTSIIPGASITNMNDVICNEARRRVWLQIRKLIPFELRNLIEQDED